MRFSPIGLLSARQRWDSNPRIPDLQSGPLNQLGYVAIRRVEDSNLYILAECRFSKPVLYQLSQHAIAGRSGHDPESAILETSMHPIAPSTHTTTRGLEPPCPCGRFLSREVHYQFCHVARYPRPDSNRYYRLRRTTFYSVELRGSNVSYRSRTYIVGLEDPSSIR